MAGKSLEHTSPVYPVVIQTPIIRVVQERRDVNYYYVPLIGLIGFWLFEDETKGKQPYDDIIRVLCDDYIKYQAIKIKQ